VFVRRHLLWFVSGGAALIIALGVVILSPKSDGHNAAAISGADSSTAAAAPALASPPVSLSPSLSVPASTSVVPSPTAPSSTVPSSTVPSSVPPVPTSVAPATSAPPVVVTRTVTAAATTPKAVVPPAPMTVAVSGSVTWEIDVATALVAEGLTAPTCKPDDGAVNVEDGVGTIIQTSSGQVSTVFQGPQQSLTVLKCSRTYRVTAPVEAVYQVLFTNTPPGDGDGCYGNGMYHAVDSAVSAGAIAMPTLHFYYACA
jgi:hypothetical protein